MSIDLVLLKMARKRALASRKANTKVGAILVDKFYSIVAEASNDFIYPVYDDINSVPECERSFYSEHAERRLIFSAIALGVSDFQEKTLVVTHFPCCDCARAIIMVGIRKIISFKEVESRYLERWGDNIAISKKMLEYNNVELILK